MLMEANEYLLAHKDDDHTPPSSGGADDSSSDEKETNSGTLTLDATLLRISVTHRMFPC